MSVRHRSIAGAPQRPAGAAAAQVSEMVTETLTPASAVDDTQVASELDAALPAIRSLIAAKQLADEPIVLVADPLRLEIRVVCGPAAIGMHEQLGKVAGAAKATDWSLHVPASSILGSLVTSALAKLQHVTTDPPPTHKQHIAAAADHPVVDLEALRLVGGSGS